MGTPPDLAGELGQSLELGIDQTNLGDLRSGGRFTFGFWLDESRRLGLETSFLFLPQQVEQYHATSPDIPILARPFHNVISDKEDALLIAYPGYLSGSIAVRADNELWGSETLLRLAFTDSDSLRLHGLFGYRFAYLRDDLRIGQTSEWLVDDGFIYVGTNKRIFDEFATNNEFHGGTLGLAFQVRRPRWFLDLTGKVSLGNTWSTVRIDGSTTTTVPGANAITTNGGLLALGTNIGEHKLRNFSVIPEASVTLGYNITPRFQVSLGYTFIYWTGVTRPGNQIDLAVNPSQFPPGPLVGPARPEFPARSTAFWAQGLNLGIEYRF